MKRQSNGQIASRVYSYGTVPPRIAPVINEDQALDQLRLANRLWNVLVAIERARVARYLKIMRDEEQGRIDTLKESISGAIQEIKARRQAARKHKGVDVSDLQSVIEEARSELRPLIAGRKATAAARHDERRVDLTANTERAGRRIKRARQAAAGLGLYWGTYNEVVQRADAGRKHGGQLHFRGFRGGGTLTAQVMGGAGIDECLGEKHRVFQIGPAPDPKEVEIARETNRKALETWRTTGRREFSRVPKKPRYARVRIGSKEAREPIWLEIPIVYARELPVAADIRSVSVSRRVDGGRLTSQLNVTVNLAKKPEKTGPAVAIDIGWRLLPEGVRVAYWEDETGQHGQVLVPLADIGRAEKVCELRSLCDKLRDDFLPPLVAWLDGQELAEEWKVKSSHLAQWRSGDRLAALIRWWGDHRLPGDPEAYEEARWWRKRHLHLSNWWRNQQESSRLRIREQYRVFAAGIAKNYGTVILEDFDLREVSELPAPENEKAAPRNHYRQIVSPSVFRLVLMNACQREGVSILKREAQYTTRLHEACGYAGKWDAAVSVIHRCDGCGTMFDQDENAARNLLRGWQADRAAQAPVLVLV